MRTGLTILATVFAAVESVAAAFTPADLTGGSAQIWIKTAVQSDLSDGTCRKGETWTFTADKTLERRNCTGNRWIVEKMSWVFAEDGANRTLTFGDTEFNAIMLLDKSQQLPGEPAPVILKLYPARRAQHTEIDVIELRRADP